MWNIIDIKISIMIENIDSKLLMIIKMKLV